MRRSLAKRVVLLALVLCGMAFARAAAAGSTVYLVSYGWHTGIALPIADIPPEALAVRSAFENSQWLEIGWGDGEFYRSRDPGVGTALRAVFLRNPAVLHVFGMRGLPSEVFPQATVRRLSVTAEGFAAMLARIDASFERDDSRGVRPAAVGLYPNSRFYRAHGHFSLLNTCNTWSAGVLAAGGLLQDPEGIVTADELLQALPSQ